MNELQIQISKSKLALLKHNADHDEKTHGNRGGVDATSLGPGALQTMRSKFGSVASAISSVDGSNKGFIDVYVPHSFKDKVREQIAGSRFLSNALSSIDSTGNQTKIRFHEKEIWVNKVPRSRLPSL